MVPNQNQKGTDMTRYHVDSEAVLHATQHAKATITRVQSDLQQLTANLQALQSSWSGQAATAFQSVLGEWRTTQHNVDAQLIAITEALGHAATHYIELEHANIRLFQR